MKGGKNMPAEKITEFETLMREYENDVLRLCFVYLGNLQLAEDAMQDSFLKVWRSMDGFEARNEASIKTWIFRIAINTCKNYRRSNWYRRVDLQEAMENLPLSQNAEDNLLLLDVMKLSPKYKQVLLLHYWQSMPVKDVCQALDISHATFYRRLQSAYKALGLTKEGM